MPRLIALDLTRLALSPLAARPRGIDRVEFAYAKFFLKDWEGDCLVSIPTVWGLRWFDRRRALAGLAFCEEVLWQEHQSADEDPVFQSIEAQMRGNAGSLHRELTWHNKIAGFVGLFQHTGLALGRSLPRALPQGSLFLSVGHVALAWSPLASWLGHRRDVRGVFMVHDAIPIEHPELVPAKSTARHHRIIDNAARYASGLIFPSRAASESVTRLLEEKITRRIPSIAAPLPVPEAFLRRGSLSADPSRLPYFVACGAFEPRKNYALLLRVWRSLLDRLGEQTPRLIIVGDRTDRRLGGMEMLDRDQRLQAYVLEAAGLGTQGLKRLLEGALGLLMPSLAEGFGLPIIEALALGRPVLASNLAAHREAGGSSVEYLDPHDDEQWRNAILSLASGRPAPEVMPRPAAFVPTTTQQYFAAISSFLETLP